MLKMASESKKVRMILDGATLKQKGEGSKLPSFPSARVHPLDPKGGKDEENGMTAGVTHVRSIVEKFEKGLGLKRAAPSTKRTALKVAVALPGLVLVTLALLDELGLGEAATAIAQAAIIMFGGDRKWELIAAVMGPIAVCVVGSILARFGLLQLVTKMLFTGKHNERPLRKWIETHLKGRVGLLRRLQEREKEEGIYVESLGGAVVAYIWERSIWQWAYLWAAGCVEGVKKEGVWVSVVKKGFVARSFARLRLAWTDYWLDKRWDTVVVAQEAEVEVEKEAVEEEKEPEVEVKEPEPQPEPEQPEPAPEPEPEPEPEPPKLDEKIEALVDSTAGSIILITFDKTIERLIDDAEATVAHEVVEALAENFDELHEREVREREEKLIEAAAERVVDEIVLAKVVTRTVNANLKVVMEEVVEALAETFDKQHEEERKERERELARRLSISPKRIKIKIPKKRDNDPSMDEVARAMNTPNVSPSRGLLFVTDRSDKKPYWEDEEPDDDALLGGYDSDANLEEFALNYTVPEPFAKHAFRMAGPAKYLVEGPGSPRKKGK
jgi:hypothetical protein